MIGDLHPGTCMCSMEYKGYHGSAALDAKTQIWSGHVIGIRDVVTFQGDSAMLKQAFEKSVDDYLGILRESRGEELEIRSDEAWPFPPRSTPAACAITASAIPRRGGLPGTPPR